MERPLALVTGATSGIGLATARVLAAAGYDLLVTGRRQERLDALEDELAPLHNASVIGLPFDIRDAAALDTVVRAHPGLFGRVDVLVNNAGLARGTEPFHEGDPDEWDEVLDTNVKALLRMTRAIVPGMVSRGKGHIVNLGSVAGRWTYPGGAVYCASKFAVRALSEGMRLDLHGTGIRVTNIEPGLVKTEFSDVRFRGDAERAAKVYADTDVLLPEDIAETILWCVQRPARVNIQEVVVFPTVQANVTTVKRGS
jgi:3-hydroxy acid dehydrogenase/malonic semialdehyde reductase